VPFHFDQGEFTAKNVVNSFAVYTAEGCKASYSDYFRNNPGTDIEVVSDYEVDIPMREGPPVNFDYGCRPTGECPSPAKPSGTQDARVV